MAEIHRKLDLVKFLLITTEVIIEVSCRLEGQPLSTEPAVDEWLHELALHGAAARGLDSRRVSPPDPPVAGHAGAARPGLGPALALQEAACHRR